MRADERKTDAHSLLFAGLLLNREKLPPAVQWLHDISFTHAAFEALLANELRYLTLSDHRYVGELQQADARSYGVDIEVPSAAILCAYT